MKLCIPEKCLDQHLVALGKTGAGKSSALRHMVEHLLARKKHVCVVDPKGDWWGLKRSADGANEGFPVVAFGNFKEERATDIPINEHAGKSLAELVATGNRPCIVGFRGWMPGAMTRFWIDFASTLFNTNGGELYLVVDEVHNFAPKGKVMDPDAGKCLHWTNRLMNEGRGVGLVCLIASQRPQKVHNDTLTACETLVALRVIHSADRQAIKDWIDGCGDPAQGRDMLANLASLPRGEAYVWSPEIAYGPQRVKFPMFETFDSFAPPQLQKKVSGRGWEATDLDLVRTKFTAVIEEAKANDPRELKTKISKLLGEIAKLESAAKIKTQVAEAKPAERVEVYVPDPKAIAFLQNASENIAKLEPVLEGIGRAISAARQQLNQLTTPTPRHIATTAAPKRQATVAAPREERHGTSGGGPLSKAERAILCVLVQRNPEATSKSQASILSGYSSTSSSFANALGSLRSQGFMEGTGDQLRSTEEGRAILGHVDPLPTGDQLIAYWGGKLGLAERTIFNYITSAYPNPMTKEQLSEQSGYSLTSSSFANALGKLRTLELINRGQEIRASDHLFA